MKPGRMALPLGHSVQHCAPRAWLGRLGARLYAISRPLLMWAVCAAALAWALHLKHPMLYFLRPLETPFLLGFSLVGGIWSFVLLRRTAWFSVRARHALTLTLMLMVLAVTVVGEVRFQQQRRAVLAAGWEMRAVGGHFMIGFRDWEEVEPLAAKGLIGGIYISGRNVAGQSVAEVGARIAHLQQLRAAAGLQPLLVAADQEGGRIEHLSPLLPEMPPLASFAALAPAQAAQAAHAYGREQGGGLLALGVNMNLAPVVDLKPARPIGFGDTRTLISQRAIAADTRVVENIARAYGKGLEEAGVQPTLKHFPGLARVRQDTHHRAGHLAATPAELAADWMPFREIGRHTGAAIMLGHVVLDKVDARHAASHSQRVVQRVLRQEFAYDGLLITDDLNMGAVFDKGVGTVATEALDAGVDIILISYDPDQYYRALPQVARAYSGGAMDKRMLALSDRRLATRGQQLAARRGGQAGAARVAGSVSGAAQG